MNLYEKAVGVIGALLWALMLVLLLVGCQSTPAEPEWDRCYETIDLEGNDVTYCERDTTYHHE